MTIDSRAVSKQLIAHSFRGILRISPNNNIDGGLSTELSPVSDSIGNLSPLSLSTERVKINSPLEINHLTGGNDIINIDSPANFNSSLSIKNIEIDTDNTNDGDILIAKNNKYISKNLLEHLANFLVPVGTIIAYAGLNNPTGWLVCDGRVITRADYPALYNLLSELPELLSDDGVKLPDLRSNFIRGYDNRDPAREFCSIQESAAPNINGKISRAYYGYGQWGFTGAFGNPVREGWATRGGGGGDPSNISFDFDASRCSSVYKDNDENGVKVTEVRPININLNYIIKT